ncbi:MAG: RNA-binding S4 domain-containing protein [Oscillospiraceae bacterium]
MRLDKFLKISRIIKRRTVANEVCDASRVTVNGRPAKASRDVAVGDIVELMMGGRAIKFRILSVDEKAGKDSARELYETLVE